MLRITIDKETESKLWDCLEPLEICDDTGRVMARLTPDADYRREVYDRAKAMFTDEDIARARKQTGGVPLSEILAELGAINGAVHSDLDAGSPTTIGKGVVTGS